ncbi:MAG TPA: hypothetical protein VKR30_12555 [Candidatus Limnocylindrales bacterium]|nr:hypothetical protein [Candidatus Limnocylindrales bacterium]
MIEVPAATAVAPAKLNVAYVAIIGVATGLVSLITVFAWPFAILTGMVIGLSDVERRAGIRHPAAATILRLLEVTGGVLGMLFFGFFFGIVGGFVIVALAAFNERVIAGTSSTDRAIGRIALIVVAVLTWLILAVVLNLHITLGAPQTTIVSG